jgi:hypothetical protein
MSSDRISAIALCYHYRDSQEAVVYFSNPQHLPVELVTHRLSPIKRPGGYLYPQQWGLASLAPPGFPPEFHDISALYPCKIEAEKITGSIDDFIHQVRQRIARTKEEHSAIER